MGKVILFASLMFGCAHAPAPVVEPILSRLDSNITTRFLQDEPPTEDELYVCRIAEDDRLVCLSWERFMLLLQSE